MSSFIENLPRILPALTELKQGDRKRAERPKGSSDSFALAQEGLTCREKGRLLMVVCSDPSDVLRYQDEISWFAPDLRVLSFPDWETLPYDIISPHSDLTSERLETLYSLLNRNNRSGTADILLVSATTASQRLAPRSFISSTTFFFKQGEKVDIQKLKSHLVGIGYENVSQVVASGEFSVRGGLLDLFPSGNNKPYRLDFFDDEIDEIRIFDPDTQRSQDKVQEIRVLPGHEFPMDEEGRKLFLSHWREKFPGDPTKMAIYKDIENGIASAGIENYLPLFFHKTETLFDYVGEDTAIVFCGPIEETLNHFHRETQARAKFLEADGERPILDLSELYLTSEEFFIRARDFSRLNLTTPADNDIRPPIPSIAVNRKAADPIFELKNYIHSCKEKDGRVLVVTPSRGRMDSVCGLFEEYGLHFALSRSFEEFLRGKETVEITVAPLYNGLVNEESKLFFITETELFASGPQVLRRRRKRERATDIDMIIRDLSELKIGDPVVHVNHGIGRYQGLSIIETPEGPAEFLHLKYAKEGTLYVPVAQLHLISRYSGADPEHAPLHALGRGDWEKTKKKAAKMARDTAAELLNLYALRESRKGYAFKFTPQDYELFCEGFPFEETEDQAQAIQAVLEDMKSGKPMDRLVCGDVGFGKTEVALRAAFAAVSGGKQVAVLCPTTLLAEQHSKTFKDRFSNWPVTIAELSRFRSSKETTNTLKGLEKRCVDIVVGTHKLLSETVKFADLGLVIIDEEHRFGVRQKEKLKSLRAEVDILTLTATPIPRTLSMSLEGIRDFSIIATAPQKRLAIKTFVRRESDSLTREAILRELKRGGQVYFLHNEVETIENRRELLAQLVPEARIAVAHGQMNEKDLEVVMRDFYAQRTNVLLCTTIIETGIDIPNANTIIIHRADKFGLAQLHQLRGRVGRSHHQAYAYLLTPPEGAMTKNAEKRLDAVQSMEDLGSGFYLAMHDLEIRGAGEVLGENQSGIMTDVGFDLYSQMLESAVKALRKGQEPNIGSPLAATTEINLHAPALLPSNYIEDVGQRLAFYKKLASAKTSGELAIIREEIIDRYGEMDDASKNLMLTHRIRLEARPLSVSKIDAGEEAIVFSFENNPDFDVSKLFLLLQSRRDLKMMGPQKVLLKAISQTPQRRAEIILGFLEKLK